MPNEEKSAKPYDTLGEAAIASKPQGKISLVPNKIDEHFASFSRSRALARLECGDGAHGIRSRRFVVAAGAARLRRVASLAPNRRSQGTVRSTRRRRLRRRIVRRRRRKRRFPDARRAKGESKKKKKTKEGRTVVIIFFLRLSFAFSYVRLDSAARKGAAATASRIIIVSSRRENALFSNFLVPFVSLYSRWLVVVPWDFVSRLNWDGNCSRLSFNMPRR